LASDIGTSKIADRISSIATFEIQENADFGAHPFDRVAQGWLILSPKAGKTPDRFCP
jgi:hypothetical protein